jgi:glutamine amidotransferase
VAVTADVAEIERRDGLCVPGQGIFGRCMEALASRDLDGAVRAWVASERPFLGICLGMQILFESSEESPHGGLGILPGKVSRLPASVTVPHIGWNTVSPGGVYYYFDHSYAVHPSSEVAVTGWCEHGDRFAAQIESQNVLAVQFHPEKSGASGIELLKGWVST